MRIAFITYEYPPDIAQGGIATYVAQASSVLQKRGHEVEVFCASHKRTISECIDKVWVHRCLSQDPATFQLNCVKIFSKRNAINAFDIMESPEIHGNALKIKETFPAIPLVVKLHMPLYLQMRLFNFYTTAFTKMRFFLGSIRRGNPKKFGHHNHLEDVDYKMTMMADGIISPSTSLKEIISAEWKITKSKIEVLPYPFQPSARLLEIPTGNSITNTVTFIGKLNVHKGMVNLVKVIPLVAKHFPDVVFNLIGNDSYFSIKKMMMSAYINQQLKGFEKNFTIKGGLQYDEIAAELSATSVCIFPSIWENFPLVCMEAMSAGRAVVGSSEGGMSEMLADEAGIIVDPLNVNQMAKGIIKLLENDELQQKFGSNARAKILAKYNSEIVGSQMEQYFEKVIHGSN